MPGDAADGGPATGWGSFLTLRAEIDRSAERLIRKLERSYRDDAELLVTGVIVRVRNPEGPVSTHYLFEPTSHREAIELLDETRRALIEEAY
ncbi:MAG TPA: hypothetical protein VH391_03050 [Solirubrobacterales bacterium]